MNHTLVLRRYTPHDFPQLLEIQRECFPLPYPEEQLWTLAQVTSHYDNFPAGAMCVEAPGGTLVGSCTSLIKQWHPTDPSHSWAEATDSGFLRNHNPEGNVLYGVDIAVRPSWRGRGVAKLMYEGRYQLVRDLGLERFVAVSRISGFHTYRSTMTAQDYVARVTRGTMVDPVITPQMKAGLIPGDLYADYIPDEESSNFALVMAWMNPDRKSKAVEATL